MALPTKKMYGRNGKLIFDPNNPEDVKNYKEKQPLIEALKLVQGLTDPRGSAGLTGMVRVINRATGPIADKAAKKALDVVKKRMTRVKKAATTTKTTPAVKEVVETKPAIPTTIPSTKTTEPVKKALTREEMKAYYQKTQKALNTAKEIVSNKKLKTELEKIREANKPFYEKSIKEAVDASNKKIAIGTGIIGGLTAAGGTYYGIQQSTKNNKQTTTPQKTGPVDLKRISNIRPSNIEGVSIVKGSDGKDYGIVWNNTTKSWDYYRGNKNKKTNEPTVVKKEDVGGGGYIPIKDNKGSGTNTGGGTGTKPRSATGQSFDKAFAEARKQAGGAGGIFEWNGKKYGTALVGETVPKNRVEVGKTTTPVTTPVTVKNDYPTAKTDPTLEIAMQEDSIRQQTATKPLPTKPLSSLVFKTTSKDIKYKMDEQDALRSILENNKLPLKKKRYGGNLTMLKYMK